MRIRKAATNAKIEANRANAASSTGPRTEHGKRNSRFNAVTLGLFAKHVVIPICDGYKAENHFKSLLDGLHQEFHPKGFYEEWLVAKIAECMWRLRRATRCESGSVREAATWARRPERNWDIPGMEREISLLITAEEQLRQSGTLSQAVYEKVAPLVEMENNQRILSEENSKPVKADFDRDLFLKRIVDRKESLEGLHRSLSNVDGQRFDARFDYGALLPEEDMDRILRYEERMHRQIDWAVQRLLEHQERRRTTEQAK